MHLTKKLAESVKYWDINRSNNLSKSFGIIYNNNLITMADSFVKKRLRKIYNYDITKKWHFRHIFVHRVTQKDFLTVSKCFA